MSQNQTKTYVSIAIAALISSTLVLPVVETKALLPNFNRFGRYGHSSILDSSEESSEEDLDDNLEDIFEEDSDEDSNENDVTFFKPYDTSELLRILHLLNEIQTGRVQISHISGSDAKSINLLLDRFTSQT